MKSLILAAAAAAALFVPAAGAQFAGSGSWFNPSGQASAHAAAHRTAEPERCQLVYGGYYVIALATPRGAASWDLEVRSPGLDAAQGGPLTGASSEPQLLSQVVLLQDPTGRGIQRLQNRPVNAELNVYDEAGRRVCRDTVRTQGPWR